MTTFSQLVDAMVLEHLRPDLLTTIVSYVNQTIREVHMNEKSGLPIYFESNRDEDEITVLELPALWPIPSVPRFQAVEAIFYSDINVYAKRRAPIKTQLEHTFGSAFWYRTGAQIALSGVVEGSTVKISWFDYPRQLAYYTAANRPAVWNVESQTFSYHADYNSTDELKETARELSTNWLLQRWEMTIMQGVRNKIHARLGEPERAKTSYSLYSALRMQLVNSESMELEPVYGGQ